MVCRAGLLTFSTSKHSRGGLLTFRSSKHIEALFQEKTLVNLVRRNHVIAIETIMPSVADFHMVLQAINGFPADAALLPRRLRLLYVEA